MAAAKALSACATLSTSRVPALYVVSGKSEHDSFASRILSPDILLERLETAIIDVHERVAKESMTSTESSKRNKVDGKAPAAAVRFGPVAPFKASGASAAEVGEVLKDQQLPEEAVATGAERNPAHPPEVEPNTEDIGTNMSHPMVDAVCASLKVEEEEEDEDFPMFVDADPDEEDVT
jgi:hypothetical protein